MMCKLGMASGCVEDGEGNYSLLPTLNRKKWCEERLIMEGSCGFARTACDFAYLSWTVASQLAMA